MIRPFCSCAGVSEVPRISVPNFPMRAGEGEKIQFLGSEPPTTRERLGAAGFHRTAISFEGDSIAGDRMFDDAKRLPAASRQFKARVGQWSGQGCGGADFHIGKLP